MKSENDDGGDDAASSRYSSCGESEFERYSSANSAMGTPSVCSSITVFNDFPELELGGSSRSLGFGLESFALGGEKKIERNYGGAKRLSDETRNTKTGSGSANYGSSGFELYGNESDGISFSGFNNGLVNSWIEVKCEPRLSRGSLESDNGGSEKGDRNEDGDCGDDDDEEVLTSYGEEKVEEREDGESSRDEHSEGGDSTCNYGTDEERRVEIDDPYGNSGRSVQAKTGNENPLLINSSVAYGSEDWDDFELAMPLDSLNLGIFHEREEKRIREAKREALNSIPAVNMAVSSSSRIEASDELDKSVARTGFRYLGKLSEVDVKDIPVASCQVQGVVTTQKVEDLQKEDSSQITFIEDFVQGGDGLVDFPKTNVAEEFPEEISFEKKNDGMLYGKQNMHNSRDLAKPNAKFDRVDDLKTYPISSSSTISSKNTTLYMIEDTRRKTESFTLRDNMRKNVLLSGDHRGKHPMPIKTEARERNELYDEVVLEMEEILLASNESPGGARFPHHSSNRALQSQLSLPIRDGGGSASTSGTDDAYPFSHQPLRIDGVEVVGARQKKGDVSLGERLVGVKEYTLYNIRVWSGDDQWVIERRYRDFSTLYHRLKTIFASQGCALPSPWDAVERESRKIFGNSSPDVVSERSVLIQACLQSVLRPRFFTTSSSALAWFLCPRDSTPSSPASSTTVSQSVYSTANRENVSTLGKTISLIVEIQPYKSVKQMLESQHYTCAGCYKHLDNGYTLIRDFAQTFGFGKPRLCEYTCQLFCSSCHANETAVLPARVLHNWDFAQYPVSQMAKSYLDSIHDQPMLCVSAVNPFLFSKVPTLLHVMGVRRKIGSILQSYVRCSFRGSINRGLGSRRYLLESNDFFALRDLIDLSKGAFAVMPVMVETVLKKIVEHITDQCLVCCDVGVPCGARQACSDPSSLIFPFQEGNAEKCPSCESEFHKACYRKLTECHCGARLRTENNTKLAKRLNRGVGGEGSVGTLDFLGKGLGSGLSVGFFSGLFSRAAAKPEKSFGEHRNSDNIILMGSLPSTTL